MPYIKSFMLTSCILLCLILGVAAGKGCAMNGRAATSKGISIEFMRQDHLDTYISGKIVKENYDERCTVKKSEVKAILLNYDRI